MADRAVPVLLWLIAVVLGGFALWAAAGVIAPIAFALFIIALAWPVQQGVQRRLGSGLGLLAAMLAAMLCVLALVLAVGWAVTRVGGWVSANAGMLTALYSQQVAWLEARGFEGASAIGAQLDMRWLLRLASLVTGQLQGALSFAVVTIVFVILGLLEVTVVGSHLAARGTPGALAVLAAAKETARKLRFYMGVRTVMSLATGLAVWAFARAVGLELAAEWGVIAFAMNYIPFLGPLVATLFPTLFAGLQFGSWQSAITVFAALQVIQFLSGSYIEPRLAGRSLALSPFMVLVAVFLGALVWGMAGALIGVPVLIAIVTLCEQLPSGRFAAALLSGKAP